MQTVLHVDDDPAVRRALRRMLQLAGLQVCSVESAEQAERALRSRRFGVAVIDRDIGDDDGLELIARLRRAHPTLSLILLTGRLTADVVDQAHELGASRCLSKTTEPRRLVAEVFAFAGGSGVLALDPDVTRSLAATEAHARTA